MLTTFGVVFYVSLPLRKGTEMLEKTVRTTTGLLDTLFETLDSLKEGTITPQDTTARVAVSSRYGLSDREGGLWRGHTYRA